jgi:hypothetical protein
VAEIDYHLYKKLRETVRNLRPSQIRFRDQNYEQDKIELSNLRKALEEYGENIRLHKQRLRLELKHKH